MCQHYIMRNVRKNIILCVLHIDYPAFYTTIPLIIEITPTHQKG